jgi:ABC-2 type transport system permease protein
MLALVENEMLKIFRRKRFRVVLLILTALIAIFTFGRWKTEQDQIRRQGPRDWHAETQRHVVEMQNRLKNPGLPPSMRRWMSSEVARLQYSLDHGFDPGSLNGPVFARSFIVGASFLLLPLLVSLFASDLVSSELSGGTIKILLTRPARRWKVLAAKLLALFSCVTLTIFLSALLSYSISGLAFGYKGWGAPILSGFRFSGGAIDFSAVRQTPLWEDTMRVYGLGWFAALVVGCLTLLLSVVFRTTAAAMGTMLACLITGTILPRLAGGWEFSKYIFVTNLPLPDYYSGTPPPIDGMTLAFSVWNLAFWGAAGLAAAFLLFTRKDMVG